MSLDEEIREILDDFENTAPERIFEVLQQLRPHFRNELISEYLQEKIHKIAKLDEQERKRQCKTLTPYFDWYLQGL